MAIIVLSNLITLVLTIVSAVFSEYAFLEMLLGGIMMILITAGHFTDGHGKEKILLEILVAVLFAYFSGHFWGFLVFACILEMKPLKAVLAADGTFVLAAGVNMLRDHALNGHSIATALVELLPLTGGVVILTVLRELMLEDQKLRSEEKKRMIDYSLREMREIKRNRELSLQNFHTEKNARLVERENISRNIHNSVGHSITAAIMTLDAADMLFEKKPEEAHRRMNDATERIRGSLESIRSAVRALDSEDSEVSVKDLMCYMDNIIEDFVMDTERTCDKIYDMYAENMLLPKEHVEFLTGALGEMLTNGVKHGQADRFLVKVSGDSAHIKLEVKDNGNGVFSEENRTELIANGFGLKKLMSYARRCGGYAEFENDKGFRSVVELPIKTVEK